MCCHPFFKTRIPIPIVEKGERGKNVKTFWIGNNTTGSILNMKAECSMNVIQWNTYTSTGWGCCLFLGFGLRFQFIRQTTSTVFTGFLLLWTITTGCWSDKKNLLLPMNSKLLNVYYSFILASINYVYMYLTLSTSACLWNQLFMETHNLKKKFCILHVSGIYSRLYRKKLPQCISNSSSIYHHVYYQPNKQIKETLPLSDEGSGFLRSSSSNKASSSTNSTSSSNMSDADKVHTLATSSCDLSTERKIANKADYGTIYY